MRLALIAAALALTACGPGTEQAPPPMAAPVATLHTLTPANLGAFFDCLRTRTQTVVEAHRGGPAPGYAEDSIEAFEHTLAQAPAFMELDVARTRDGAFVVMHDDTVDRTTDGHGAVAGMTLAQFQALRLRDDDGRVLGAHPPTFRQALDWAAGKTVLEVDVKQGVSFDDAVGQVRAAGALGRVIFITYNTGDAIRVHRLAPEAIISVSVEGMRDIEVLERAGVDLSRVLAWTGTREPDSALNVALARRGVEAMFGTLGRPGESWDSRFAAAHHDQYASLAETGLQLIASDRPADAARDLDAYDGVDGYGAMQCEGAR